MNRLALQRRKLTVLLKIHRIIFKNFLFFLDFRVVGILLSAVRGVAVVAEERDATVLLLVVLKEARLVRVVGLRHNLHMCAEDIHRHCGARDLHAVHLDFCAETQVEVKGVVDEAVCFGAVTRLGALWNVVPAEVAGESVGKPCAAAANLDNAVFNRKDVEPLVLLLELGKRDKGLNLDDCLATAVAVGLEVVVGDNIGDQLELVLVRVRGPLSRLSLRNELDPRFELGRIVERRDKFASDVHLGREEGGKMCLCACGEEGRLLVS